MVDKYNQNEYDTDLLFRQIDNMYRESMCWEEQLSNEAYLDHLDRRLYERSNPGY